MNAAIAQHLNILESAIVRIEEWKNVLFVVARGIGARFVSKKVVAMQPKKITYTYRTGEAMEMLLTQKGEYQIYANGNLIGREKAEVVLEGFKKQEGTAEHESANVQFIY